MSTAGRYVGAYRIPATDEVRDVLEKVKDGKYYDQVGLGKAGGGGGGELKPRSSLTAPKTGKE